jgi:hypothetical protein
MPPGRPHSRPGGNSCHHHAHGLPNFPDLTVEDSNVILEALKAQALLALSRGDSGQQATTPAELSVVQKS